MEMNKMVQAISLTCITFLSLLCFYLWQIHELKVSEIAKLEAEKQVLLGNEKELLGAIDKQNNLIKELQVKETLVDNSRLLEVYVKDESCEAELEAYKSLFRELGK